LRGKAVLPRETLVGRAAFDGSLESSILRAVSLIGGFGSFLKPGERVFVKPNYNSSDPPPASTDPAFAVAAVRLLRSFGASEVTVGDSSQFMFSTRRVLEETGLWKAVEAVGARVAVLGERGWVKVRVGQRLLREVELAKEAFEFDRVVYLCCLKTHRFAGYSISLKHGMGFVRPLTRIGWHLRGLEERIAELNTVIKPDLILLDARKCFITGGPFRGEVAEPSLIMASADRVALDVEGLKVIGGFPGNSLRKSPWEYMQVRRAVELGVGATSEREYRVVEGTS
jgi:uncharacterized protein (DUF362 family)